MAKIEIDYFESTKLLEVALYSHTAVCGIIKEKFAGEWFHCYNSNEKRDFYYWFQREISRTELIHNHESINEEINKILARYNPDNQFMVTVKLGSRQQTVSAYLFNGTYYTGGPRNQYCEPLTIKKIVKIENYGEKLPGKKD